MSHADPPPPQADFAVVGGGILGLAVARELLFRHPDATLVLLEAENRLAAHQTTHSSGVIHAGVYYEPGSLRAKLCVEGAAELIAYCEQSEIPWRRSGKLIVATDETELERLDRLESRGRANGVPGLTRIESDAITEIEPGATGISALHSPNTGVVDFGLVARSFAGDVERAGGTIHTSAPVIAIRSGRGPKPDRLAIETSRGTVSANRAVFCAGLQSDRLARMAGGDPAPRIVPIRGGYLKVKPGREDLVRGNVYPTPDPELPFLGAHLTRGFDGSLLIGPTAMMAAARDAYRLTRVRPRDLWETVTWPGSWRLIRRNLGTTVTEIRHSVSPRSLLAEARRMVPGLRDDDVLPGPAGVRAQALGRDGGLIEDFLIERTENAIHVRNAPSPAATSSMALARLIADQAS
ncbi:MAG TPA: L-2-hydroxyglutarate oxidase [Solirubrobacterales bacterium]|nr:L-2-hydroxyglutarate oxidase [Solirubrobacterales bacterium]